MGHVITAVLMAPQFLFRVEQNREQDSEPYPIDDYELASRLSFFLWSRPPDNKLLQLAAAGRLREPRVLRNQTLRMLQDERGDALVHNFFGQWLGLDKLAGHAVDLNAFPEFSENLRQSMQAEVEAVLRALVARTNR